MPHFQRIMQLMVQIVAELLQHFGAENWDKWLQKMRPVQSFLEKEDQRQTSNSLKIDGHRIFVQQDKCRCFLNSRASLF